MRADPKDLRQVFEVGLYFAVVSAKLAVPVRQCVFPRLLTAYERDELKRTVDHAAAMAVRDFYVATFQDEESDAEQIADGTG